jgi:hypothetical protein
LSVGPDLHEPDYLLEAPDPAQGELFAAVSDFEREISR